VRATTSSRRTAPTSDEYVVVDHGGSFLIAWYVEPGDGLPEADEVGRALADAEQVDWADIVGLD
jgi:hypothetical protein